MHCTELIEMSSGIKSGSKPAMIMQKRLFGKNYIKARALVTEHVEYIAPFFFLTVFPASGSH